MTSQPNSTQGVTYCVGPEFNRVLSGRDQLHLTGLAEGYCVTTHLGQTAKLTKVNYFHQHTEAVDIFLDVPGKLNYKVCLSSRSEVLMRTVFNVGHLMKNDDIRRHLRRNAKLNEALDLDEAWYSAPTWRRADALNERSFVLVPWVSQEHLQLTRPMTTREIRPIRGLISQRIKSYRRNLKATGDNFRYHPVLRPSYAPTSGRSYRTSEQGQPLHDLLGVWVPVLSISPVTVAARGVFASLGRVGSVICEGITVRAGVQL